MDSLFTKTYEPLANRMRPTNLDEFVGQEHLVGEKGPLRQMIENDTVTSMIFWGPPGVGKTTLAKIIAEKTQAHFQSMSAINSGVKDIKNIATIAHEESFLGHKTIVFVDEIHRFNKAQQDAFLPYVESGDIILIGATTENPSFEVNSALLSRVKVYVLNALTKENIVTILKRALNGIIDINDDALEIIAETSGGDARNALNTLENIMKLPQYQNMKITKDNLEDILSDQTFMYDKKGEEHYNLISALHKSMRNSDVDASVYYLARMLEAGENPLYIARRLVRFASEDIGLANSNALLQATAAYQACHYIGMPECNVNLTQAVIYLAVSPKSNSLEVAYDKAKIDARKTQDLKVPLHLRNAVTKLDSELGYGKDYQYAHNYKEKMTNMTCLPEPLKHQTYYTPTDSGNEKNIAKRLNYIKNTKESMK